MMAVLRRIRGLAAVVCVVAILSAMPAFGIDPHHVEGTSLGAPIDLNAAWLVHQGDDLRWADPKLDDSQWTAVKAGKPLGSYGLKNVDQVWYRLHVQIPPGQKDLALLMRSFGGSFEIFVNGTEVGTSGPHQPGGSGNATFDRQYPVPAALVSGGDMTVAVRASIGRVSENGTRPGGFASYTVLLLGPSRLLAESSLLYQLRNFASNASNIVMELLVALIAMALALTLPKEREYVALVIASGTRACRDIFVIWQITSNTVPTDFRFLLDGCLQTLTLIATLEFVRLVLGLRRPRWFVVYEWLIVAVQVPGYVWINHAFTIGSATQTGTLSIVINVFAQILSLPVAVGIPVLALWIWWRRDNPDALLLFVPFFLQSVVQYANFFLFLLYSFHLSDQASLPSVPINTFFLQWSEVAIFMFGVTLLLFLVLRTARLARASAAMASDLHAVQSVQEILLARASHPTPGFVVEHAYLPAQEVGGDFFLVSPGPDGSLTAIVGDVSGKGLVAAMRVSMILGVLRREDEREPGMILKALNEALLMQNDMGFTTACCIHLDREGCYAVANAGHISPYIDGFEIVTEPSLPLGLAPGQDYHQISGLLPSGKTIVLMSDGVVEARSAKGELYGFERLRKLTLMSAEDIAGVAQRFGQEDDITVLTVACA